MKSSRKEQKQGSWVHYDSSTVHENSREQNLIQGGEVPTQSLACLTDPYQQIHIKL